MLSSGHNLAKCVIILFAISNVLSYKLSSWRMSSATPSPNFFPVNRLQKKKQGILTFSIASLGAVAILGRPQKSRGADFNLPECSDSITVLKSSDRQVLLIGTAHISEDSAALVRNMIRTTKPNVVMVELDAKRLGRVSKESLGAAGFDLPLISSGAFEAESIQEVQTRKNVFSALMSGITNQIGSLAEAASGAILGTVLSQFYKSVEKLGFNPGGELKAAITEGYNFSPPTHLYKL